MNTSNQLESTLEKQSHQQQANPELNLVALFGSGQSKDGQPANLQPDGQISSSTADSFLPKMEIGGAETTASPDALTATAAAVTTESGGASSPSDRPGRELTAAPDWTSGQFNRGAEKSGSGGDASQTADSAWHKAGADWSFDGRDRQDSWRGPGDQRTAASDQSRSQVDSPNAAGKDASEEQRLQAHLQKMQLQIEQMSAELAKLMGDPANLSTAPLDYPQPTNPPLSAIDTTSPSTPAETTAPATTLDTSAPSTPAETTTPATTVDTSAPSTPADTTTPATTVDTTAPFTPADTTTPATPIDTTTPSTPADTSTASTPSDTTTSPAPVDTNSPSAPVSAAGNYSVINGQIIGPDGQPFDAKGVAVYAAQAQSEAATIMQQMPDLNFIRLASTPATDSPADIQADIQAFQSINPDVVVEVEDHTSGGTDGTTNNTLSGQDLTNEENWYSQIAAANANNPNVWFGTANEPNDPFNEQDVVDQEAGIYSAIRATGNNNMIMLEADGGGSFGPQQADTSAYNAMSNVAWDIHYYGWETSGDTSVSNNVTALQNEMAGASGITESNGAGGQQNIPFIVGEYGDSTNGQTVDANGTAAVDAVQTANNQGLVQGAVGWTWNGNNEPNNSDAITQDGTMNTVTPYGQEMINYVNSGSSGAVD